MSQYTVWKYNTSYFISDTMQHTSSSVGTNSQDSFIYILFRKFSFSTGNNIQYLAARDTEPSTILKVSIDMALVFVNLNATKTGVDSRDCWVAIGSHFEKLATNYWSLVTISGYHFLTYKKIGSKKQNMHPKINKLLDKHWSLTEHERVAQWHNELGPPRAGPPIEGAMNTAIHKIHATNWDKTFRHCVLCSEKWGTLDMLTSRAGSLIQEEMWFGATDKLQDGSGMQEVTDTSSPGLCVWESNSVKNMMCLLLMTCCFWDVRFQNSVKQMVWLAMFWRYRL